MVVEIGVEPFFFSFSQAHKVSDGFRGGFWIEEAGEIPLAGFEFGVDLFRHFRLTSHG